MLRVQHDIGHAETNEYRKFTTNTISIIHDLYQPPDLTQTQLTQTQLTQTPCCERLGSVHKCDHVSLSRCPRAPGSPLAVLLRGAVGSVPPISVRQPVRPISYHFQRRLSHLRGRARCPHRPPSA